MQSGRETELDSIIAGIKAGANIWYAEAALELLRQHFSGRRGIAARSIYVALAEFAAEQLSPATFVASRVEIGRRAAIEAHLVGQYLSDFAKLGLLDIEQGSGGENIYTLLDPATGLPREYPTSEAEAPTSITPLR